MTESDKEVGVEEALPVKTNKELFIERMASKYPDMDEEAMHGEYLKHMDEMDRASEAHKALGDKLTQHPKAAMVLADIMDGKHPAVAMNRYFDPKELEIEEGDENYEALIQAEKDRQADNETSEAMKAEYQQNLLNSQADVEKFCKDKGISEEEFSTFIEGLMDKVSDLLSGNLNIRLLESEWKIRNYESDIEQAKEVGRVSARNEKALVEKKRFEGDGLPNIKTAAKKETYIPTPRKSVWEK